MYDIIIIGGGIGGLYTAYQISKKSSKLKLLLIEKENYLGGRVLTYHDKVMNVEEGAGRISGSQPIIMNLIRELGLNSKLSKNGSEAVFSPADKTGSIESSVTDAPKNPKDLTILEPIYENILTIALGKKTLPNAELILKLIIASKTYSKKSLQNQTLESFATKVLTKEQVQYIKRSFGYYSELVIMNAYDAIKLFSELSPTNIFYSMKGGLSQIIDKMEEKISRNSNIVIWKSCEVNQILFKDEVFNIDLENPNKQKKTVYSKKCVCALPKNVLNKMKIFNPIKPILDKVECGTLCRIYSKFDKNPDGKVWFEKLPKMTTDNEIRMIIPYNKKEGIIMISYSDNKYADFWNRIYKDKGIKEVNKVLKEKIYETTGIKIPTPKHTKIFYWGCGVGYWGVGADSEKISKIMIKPFPKMELYVCGENFSENGQQWIEGALETSETVVTQILIEK